MESQDVNFLDKLPVELWETVFDHLGPGLRQAQLTCRLFRELAVTRLWRNVCISVSGDTTASCSTWISHHNILFASQVLPSVASHIKKLTVELINDSRTFSDMGYCYRSDGEEAMKLAVSSAEEIHLIVHEGCLYTKLYPVRKKLLEYLRDFCVPKKLSVTIHSPDLRYDDVTEIINWSYPITASIEVEAIIDGFTTPCMNELVKYVTQLKIDFDAPVSDLDELLREFPRLTGLALKVNRMRPGHLILPPSVSQFQVCGVRNYTRLNCTETTVLSSKFVTHLQLDTIDLSTISMTLDFPNIRSLELTALSGFDDIALERMGQLTKGLDRFVLREGESKWLTKIAPLICNVRHEIQLIDLITDELENKRKYIKDLVDFMSYSPTTPSILLELPFVEPELLVALIKLLVDRCAGLRSLSTTDAYPPKELITSARYPYLYRAEMAHGYDCPAAFEINLRYIRGLDSSYNREVECLLDDVITQWQAIPPDDWDMERRRRIKKATDLLRVFSSSKK
ncbi:hypothetical protein TRVA0_019S01134 [Trichomonascus vanleenenianus]|uniref:uncharacterized protein n=1 Tax=Trichomonascus vanleenenianus TaxID=2268995 RepID=UPI003EC9BEDF